MCLVSKEFKQKHLIKLATIRQMKATLTKYRFNNAQAIGAKVRLPIAKKNGRVKTAVFNVIKRIGNNNLYLVRQTT